MLLKITLICFVKGSWWVSFAYATLWKDDTDCYVASISGYAKWLAKIRIGSMS